MTRSPQDLPSTIREDMFTTATLSQHEAKQFLESIDVRYERDTDKPGEVITLLKELAGNISEEKRADLTHELVSMIL